VPLDYKQAPAGRRPGVAVLRSKASQPTRLSPSLVLNPGGPGRCRHLSRAAGLAHTGVRNTHADRGAFRPLVGFDPADRGDRTAESSAAPGHERDDERLYRTPTTPRPTTAPPVVGGPAPDRCGNSPLSRRRAEAERPPKVRRAFSGADLLANFGTLDVARDWTWLRSRFG